jgi:hypothetical protein
MALAGPRPRGLVRLRGGERRWGPSLWPLTLALLGLMAAVGLLPTYIGVGLRRLSDARRARRAAADARLKAFVSETPPPPPA